MWPDCKARRVNDEYHCVECALRWDASEDAPDCRLRQSIAPTRYQKARDEGKTYKAKWADYKRQMRG